MKSYGCRSPLTGFRLLSSRVDDWDLSLENRNMKQHYQLTTLPGLAGVLGEELRDRLDSSAVEVGAMARLRNAEITTVAYAGDPGRLRELRTAEDVFVALGRVDLTGQAADVKALVGLPVWGRPLRSALEAWSAVTGKPLGKRLVWRVVVQAEDAMWRQYRRQELMLAAERALLGAGASWRVDREAAPLELWLQQAGRELLVSVRLTTGADRQHGGRAIERPAALRPSVAAALVRLARPEPDDVFLDPMCGTGTVLLERATVERYRLLLGGDSDPAAVVAALANFGPRHQPRRIEQWDARKLPLEDGYVTSLVCNLPWGRQVSERAAIPGLYAALIPEFVRVLASGGRMVLLTSEWMVLRRVLKAEPLLQQERAVRDVEVLGRRADIFVVRRPGGAKEG